MSNNYCITVFFQFLYKGKPISNDLLYSFYCFSITYNGFRRFYSSKPYNFVLLVGVFVFFIRNRGVLKKHLRLCISVYYFCLTPLK